MRSATPATKHRADAASICLAHKLIRNCRKYAKAKGVDYLRPDGKSPGDVGTVMTANRYAYTPLLSPPSTPNTQPTNKSAPYQEADHRNRSADSGSTERTVYHINPTGCFVIGGPPTTVATGRKIIVDTYGGYSCHGGGAFSGKPIPAKSIALLPMPCAGLPARGELWPAKKCEVVVYAIGVAALSRYVSIRLEQARCQKPLEEAINKTFDLRPVAIIRDLDLLPQYQKVATYGHMGREDRMSLLEKCTRPEELKSCSLICPTYKSQARALCFTADLKDVKISFPSKMPVAISKR